MKHTQSPTARPQQRAGMCIRMAANGATIPKDAEPSAAHKWYLLSKEGTVIGQRVEEGE